MDPLSDILALLKPQSYSAGGFGLTGDLNLQFPQPHGIKCYAIVKGACWLVVEGIADPIRLTAGECYILPRRRAFQLTTDLSLPPTDFLALKETGVWHTTPDTSECFLVGGHFAVEGPHADTILATLPPVIHLQQEADKDALRWAIERMASELRAPQPGGDFLTQQLAHMMLVQALRLHLAAPAAGPGWLSALADPQMNAALSALHAAPGNPWTVESLATRAGMSRSVFAERFRAVVGTTPMEYLTRWRMFLAADRLSAGRDSVATIAASLGYDSESAFGKAFRRVMGTSPRQHARGLTHPLPVAAV